MKLAHSLQASTSSLKRFLFCIDAPFPASWHLPKFSCIQILDKQIGLSLQSSGARGRTEGMHLDLTSFEWVVCLLRWLLQSMHSPYLWESRRTCRLILQCSLLKERMLFTRFHDVISQHYLMPSPCRSIVSFTETFKKKGLPLHVLVENAGVFLVPHDRTKEGFETTVGTNYFGGYPLPHVWWCLLPSSWSYI